MGFLRDIFQSRQDKQVLDVYITIDNYWKNTNDFIVAHRRYLEDLDYKYKLNFKPDTFNGLTNDLISILLGMGLSQRNSMFIFAQFIVFYVFRFDNPKIYRFADINLLSIVLNIERILIPYDSKVNPEFLYQIDKKVDVRKFFEVDSVTNDESNKRERDRVFSLNKLASRLDCTPDKLKDNFFKQLDSKNATIDACMSMIIKHEKTKTEQAKQYYMHPHDTPAAILLEFTNEYIDSLKKKKKTDKQIFNEMASSNKELMAQLLAAQAAGKMDKVEELLRQNPVFFEEFLKKLGEKED